MIGHPVYTFSITLEALDQLLNDDSYVTFSSCYYDPARRMVNFICTQTSEVDQGSKFVEIEEGNDMPVFIYSRRDIKYVED
jgi:hypothetical protein